MSGRKKHILILPKWYPNPSDLQLGIFVQNQAILMAKRFEITVIYVQGITDCPKPYVVKSDDHNGIREIKIYYKKRKLFGRFRNFLKYRNAQKLGLKLITSSIDLVHIHVPIRPAFLAQHLLTTQKTPYIVTEHWSGHLNGQFQRKSFLYRYIYKIVLNRSVAITAVSKPLSAKIEKISGKNIQIIPNYIKASKNQIGKLTGNKIQVLTVSDLNNHTKNITGLLEGFKLALVENKSLHLSIIGDGPDKKLIVDKIIAEGLEKNVVLLGRKTQNEVVNIMPKFHFYICNSNVETFGMTVAEAILAGLPVICTRCGGPEEFVNENNGILTDVNHPNNLKDALVKMVSSYNNYNTATNKADIKNLFGEIAVLEKWEEIYHSILRE